jgi:hypothetical protein
MQRVAYSLDLTAAARGFPAPGCSERIERELDAGGPGVEHQNGAHHDASIPISLRPRALSEVLVVTGFTISNFVHHG